MTATVKIELYELAKKFIKDKSEAKKFITLVEDTIDNKLESKMDVLATKIDLANTKTDIIKWMFIFWIGQILAILAIVSFMLK